MLKQIIGNTTERGVFGEYIIDNYKKTGYKVVVLATEFPATANPFKQPPVPPVPYVPGALTDWGGGSGFWQVDYPLVCYTFWNLMLKYSPIAVMTTSRDRDNKIWLLESGSTNLPKSKWAIPPFLPWNIGRPPYIGGASNDPASAPNLPNANLPPKVGDPPDASRNQSTVVNTTAKTKAVQQLVLAALTPPNFPANKLDVSINLFVQARPDPLNPGQYIDNYVSGYTGYLAVWYADWKKACKAAWHTHIGFKIAMNDAKAAIEKQLDTLIAWLNDN